MKVVRDRSVSPAAKESSTSAIVATTAGCFVCSAALRCMASLKAAAACGACHSRGAAARAELDIIVADLAAQHGVTIILPWHQHVDSGDAMQRGAGGMKTLPEKPRNGFTATKFFSGQRGAMRRQAPSMAFCSLAPRSSVVVPRFRSASRSRTVLMRALQLGAGFPRNSSLAEDAAATALSPAGSQSY